MVGQVVTFDGHRLNDLFYVGDVIPGLPEFQPNVAERVGDGSSVSGMRLGGGTIAVSLVVKPNKGYTARGAVSRLLSWLHVDGARWLTLSNDEGLRRLVVVEGAPSVDDAEWYDVLTVTFRQIEPALYGTSDSVSVPSGSVVSFEVGGDYPTLPTVTAPAAIRDSSTGEWGLTFDGTTKLHVPIGTPLASAVSVDCESGACTVGGKRAAPTLDSDWPSLGAGAHTVRLDAGTGTATLAWVERWHR